MADGDPLVALLHLGALVPAAKRTAPQDLVHKLGLAFADETLLEQAFTHSSLHSGRDRNYESLEFLGDRVLGLVIADELYRRDPSSREEHLNLQLKQLVRSETLAEIADELGLALAIRADRQGLEVVKSSRRVLADVCEALIGAVYVDQGLDAARSFILRHWSGRLDGFPLAGKDSKSLLQEWAALKGLPLPTYEEVGRSGPDHDPSFSVKVSLPGLLPASGMGKSKRQAEQEAALNLLRGAGVVSRG